MNPAIVVEKAGLQATVQAGPRLGLRHLGVPSAGAADLLSLALGNRLVGNTSLAPGIEVTLSGLRIVAESPVCVAVTGARCAVRVDARRAAMHEQIQLAAGSVLELGAAVSGVRSYLALAGGVAVDPVLGSASTYLPAGLGGFEGRPLRQGDRLKLGKADARPGVERTPEPYRLNFPAAWALRVCPGAEYSMLDSDSRESLESKRFTVSHRADRMGAALDGVVLQIASAGTLDSRPVFPGTVQCPEAGQPFILGADAQTTGGYPRIAEVIRADRHLIGQLRGGNRLSLLLRDADTARKELAAALEFWRGLLPDIETLL
ncbi:MAG: biotin-dependent carboxyltransferase family protein [Pseudomonadota bacterium]